MKIPAARGPVSTALFNALKELPGMDGAALEALHRTVAGHLPETLDIIGDDDLQLTLFCLYELHYSGLEGVGDEWEWAPELIRVRQRLEKPFEAALREAAAAAAGDLDLPAEPGVTSDAVADILFGLAGRDTGPSLSRYVSRKASLGQL